MEMHRFSTNTYRSPTAKAHLGFSASTLITNILVTVVSSFENRLKLTFTLTAVYLTINSQPRPHQPTVQQ